ncbi:mycothiol-dependent nitroreductase Rv2466c family protein, partial [Mycobacteroides abscessus]
MPADGDAAASGPFDVRIWLDPVCPFSWNTARWLDAVAIGSGIPVDWQLMNLAVLNEGRELPDVQQARMQDSRRVGRLMAGIQCELGQQGLRTAYFAFGRLYFDESLPLDAELADRV